MNWELLKHPLNWVIVVLMLVIAGAAGHLLLAKFGAEASGLDDAAGHLVSSTPNRRDFAVSVLG